MITALASHLKEISQVVTHPVINLVQQGLISMNKPVIPFCASRTFRVTGYVSLKSIVRRTLYDLYSPSFLPDVMYKLTRRVRRHFVTLIEIGMLLIESNPGHTSYPSNAQSLNHTIIKENTCLGISILFKPNVGSKDDWCTSRIHRP